MVTVSQTVLSVATVVLSVFSSGYLSWRISKRKLTTEYEWERYSAAEGWCDDYIRLIRRLQANFEYKRLILEQSGGNSKDWIPGEDLDKYGREILEHTANKPVIIFNLIGEREEGEVGISDRAGAISQDCGLLADENLREMGDSAVEQMNVRKKDLFNSCENLIEEILELRNVDLKANFEK